MQIYVESKTTYSILHEDMVTSGVLVVNKQQFQDSLLWIPSNHSQWNLYNEIQ